MNHMKFTTKKLLIIYFVVYIFISHIVLPSFNHSDYFLFARWNMFSGIPKKITHDYIYGDDNSKFLMRDFFPKISKKKIRKNVFLNYTNNKNIEEIRYRFLHKIKELGLCGNLYRVKLKGTYYQHYLLKSELPILKKELFC